MVTTYFKLLIFVTLKHPRETHDVVLRTSRTLPFQPAEGMTLVLQNDDGEEYEVELGPTRYEFAESAFAEYQEDDSLIELMREGEYGPVKLAETIAYYKSFGFENATPVQVIEQIKAQA